MGVRDINVVSCWTRGLRIETDCDDNWGHDRKPDESLVIRHGEIEPNIGNESWHSQCCCECNGQGAGFRLRRFRVHDQGPRGLYRVPWDRLEF